MIVYFEDLTVDYSHGIVYNPVHKIVFMGTWSRDRAGCIFSIVSKKLTNK